MEKEFLNWFYNTQCTVSMTKLPNTKQWWDKPLLDSISCWCALSFNCKDRLSEVSVVEMCFQGVVQDLLYIL